MLDRREFLIEGLGAAAAARRGIGAPPSPLRVSVGQFGAISDSGRDDTHAIQAAIQAVERNGGGSVLIGGRHRCGNILVSGRDVTLEGLGGWLVDARLTIGPGAANVRVANLGILETRGDSRSYLMDISGRNCRFDGVSLVKEPIAGGYQIYLRSPSSGCRFSGLRLKGSNGVMVSGHDHEFERFEFESTMSDRVGGDDAFAIKAPGAPTYNIAIRSGVVRGFAAIASFGSEIGTKEESSAHRIFVRDVVVSDVTADRCGSLAFFKPGALIYDWYDGLVERVLLERLRLTDELGERFTSGVRMIASRGSLIRNVVGRQLEVRARARNEGVEPTAAIDLSLLDGADASVEDVDLQLAYADPCDGAEHGRLVPGYPVDHIVRVEKGRGARGSMSGISIDVEGRGTRFGGVYIGPGLDDAVDLRRAHLSRVGLHPPASIGGGGIWSDSRVEIGDVEIDSPVLPRFGGRAFPEHRPPAARAGVQPGSAS